jgi:hypothetical protein
MSTVIQSFVDKFSSYIRRNANLNNASHTRSVEHSSDKKDLQISSSRIREFNNTEEAFAPFLQVDRFNNLSIENNQVYSINTDYGLINYKFINDSNSRYVETMYFDSQISDEKRVHLELKRQFLMDFQTFAETGRTNVFHTARSVSEVLKQFKSMGFTTEEPFTINNRPVRYRLDPTGILHEVDLESKTMKEQDWRKFGHDENTIFLIQGKEYKMNEEGKLPLPEDYVHKYEQVEIIKNK